MSECVVLQTQEVPETEKASCLNQSQFKYADPSAALSPWKVREEPKVLCVNIADTQLMQQFSSTQDSCYNLDMLEMLFRTVCM